VSPLSVVLVALLSGGGLTGVIALLRLRVDRGATVVETVSKGVLVLERLNDRLEADLAGERTGRLVEQAARLAAEAERDELRRLLGRYGPLPPDRSPDPA
jgi:hypothetical protein